VWKEEADQILEQQQQMKQWQVETRARQRKEEVRKQERRQERRRMGPSRESTSEARAQEWTHEMVIRHQGSGEQGSGSVQVYSESKAKVGSTAGVDASVAVLKPKVKVKKGPQCTQMIAIPHNRKHFGRESAGHNAATTDKEQLNPNTRNTSFDTSVNKSANSKARNRAIKSALKTVPLQDHSVWQQPQRRPRVSFAPLPN
jgi:hypothetical protein